MAVYTSLYDGQSVDASVGRSYVPTLNAAPTSSTLTFSLNGNTVSFEIGQFAKVAVTGGYNFYQMTNLNSGVATWEKVNYGSDKEDKMTVVTKSSGTTLTAVVGNYYRYTNNVETLTITLPKPTGSKVQSVLFFLTTGTSPNVTFTSSGNTIYKNDGFAIDASTTYEINALWNGGAWVINAVKYTT